MKLFKCGHCGQLVYFENSYCISCNATLGFDPKAMDMLALQKAEDGTFVDLKKPAVSFFKYCFNKQYNVCNWLIPAHESSQFCTACNLNRTIPDLTQADHLSKWTRIEIAKHRLVYSLLRFRLPVVSKFINKEKGIAFDFMADTQEDGERLLTGHDHGAITLNIEEADDAIREMARNQMDEVYRTLLGHFRHEIGHYYWDQLILPDKKRLQSFRNLFGDDRADYGEALKEHYANGSPADWQMHFISAYASAHPWEDWAETWAHYLHIVDTLETGYSFGVSVNPKVAGPDSEMSARLNIDPYVTQSFEEIIDRWIPLSFAMNSLNRSMGHKDSYPFVISEKVKEKLHYIHTTIRERLQK